MLDEIFDVALDIGAVGGGIYLIAKAPEIITGGKTLVEKARALAETDPDEVESDASRTVTITEAEYRTLTSKLDELLKAKPAKA